MILRAERKPNNYFKKHLEVTKINFIFALPNRGNRQTERNWRRIMTHRKLTNQRISQV